MILRFTFFVYELYLLLHFIYGRRCLLEHLHPLLVQCEGVLKRDVLILHLLQYPVEILEALLNTQFL